MKKVSKTNKFFTFNKWWILGISIFLLLAGFGSSFGAVYSINHKRTSYPSFTQYQILEKEESWKISNSYLSKPFKSKETITDNIRNKLKLSSNFGVDLYKYTDDIPKSVKELESIDTDIYSPKIILKFDYAITDGIKTVHVGNIDNSGMMDKLLNGAKTDYLDLFSVGKGSSQAKFFESVNKNLVSQNKDTIEKNIEKYKLGDAKDLPYLYSAIDLSNYMEVNTDKKTFKVTTASDAKMLNGIIDFPSIVKTKSIAPGVEYGYFEKTDVGSKYLQKLLGLKAQNSEYNFDAKKFTGDQSIKELRDAINVNLTSLALKDANYVDSLESIKDLFNISLIKTPSNMNGVYTDSQKVSDMWGFGKGKPYTYVFINGINDKYQDMKNLFSFADGYDETIWFNISVDNGGNK